MNWFWLVSFFAVMAMTNFIHKGQNFMAVIVLITLLVIGYIVYGKRNW